MKEQMRIETYNGTINVVLEAEHEDDIKSLREELFNWYEDFVEREMSDGHAVTTTSLPPSHFRLNPGSTCEADVKSGSELYDALKNLTSAYIVLKSNEALCGEVVQIPIRHEEFEYLLYKTRCYIDHIIQRYLGGYPF